MQKAFVVAVALGLVSLRGSGGQGRERKARGRVEDGVEAEAKVEELRSILANSKGEIVLQRFKDFLQQSNGRNSTSSTSLVTDEQLLSLANVLVIKVRAGGGGDCREVMEFVTNQVARIFGEDNGSSLFSDMVAGGSESSITSHMEDLDDIGVIAGLSYFLSHADQINDAESFATALITAALEGIAKSGYDLIDTPALHPEEARDALCLLVDSYLTGFLVEGALPTSHSGLQSLKQAEEHMIQSLAMLYDKVGSSLHDSIRKVASQIGSG